MFYLLGLIELINIKKVFGNFLLEILCKYWDVLEKCVRSFGYFRMEIIFIFIGNVFLIFLVFIGKNRR